MVELTNHTNTHICRRKALRLQSAVFDFYKLKERGVSLVVVGDRKMRRLNRDFRGIDKTTDVLTFPINNEYQPVTDKLIGEIFINLDEAKRTHKYESIFGRKRSYLYIFYFLFVHGLLHLVGYNDEKESDRKAMIVLGEHFMAKYYK
ncbi:MAG: putative rRNA maturation factor [Patescibacteria group bacterium]|nr:putative rRNA maturation factor [Patescibacteria group bacterium]